MTMNAVMMCYGCRTAPRVGSGAYCEACAKEAAEYRAQVESLSQTVACGSCGAFAGQPCRNGHGDERHSHMPRQTKAENKRKREAARV